jgi:hypothetical protein
MSTLCTQDGISVLLTIHRKGASLMRSFFKPPPATPRNSPFPIALPSSALSQNDAATSTESAPALQSNAIFTGYMSDILDDESTSQDSDSDGGEVYEDIGCVPTAENEESHFPIQAPPALKCCRLEIPACMKIRNAQVKCHKKLVQALKDIETLIKSKREIFEDGHNSLQSYRARAIQSYLQMVVHNKRNGMIASQIAAESQGFAVNWGSWMVRKWV